MKCTLEIIFNLRAQIERNETKGKQIHLGPTQPENNIEKNWQGQFWHLPLNA